MESSSEKSSACTLIFVVAGASKTVLLGSLERLSNKTGGGFL